MCWSGCALQRQLGVTPLLFVLRPENPCQTWDPRAKFRVLYRTELKVGGSAVRFSPTSAQLAGSASVLVRVCPTTLTRCNPVANLVLRPENPCQTWDPRAKFRVLYRTELTVGGSAVRAPDLGPTSGKCQCAGQGVPYNALLGVTPLLLVLRPENPCQTWDPRAKFRVLYRTELKVGGSAVRAPDLGPTSGKCQCAGQGVPYNAY